MSNRSKAMFYIHDTNDPKEMREVASYHADNITMLPGSAVAMFEMEDEIVAVHHLAPGHSIILQWDEEDDADEEDVVPYVAGDTVEVLSYGQYRAGRILNVLPNRVDPSRETLYIIEVEGERLTFPEKELRRPEN